MRYPEEKVRAAILSPDPPTRMMAVDYFTHYTSRGQEAWHSDA